ncbi:MAG: serine/threonine-protein kinase [Polyangiaceae bacterium]
MSERGGSQPAIDARDSGGPESEEQPRRSRFGDVFLSPGSEVAGKYVIEEIVGEGATSLVYSARRKPGTSIACSSPAAQELGDDDSDSFEALSPVVALKVIHKTLCADPQIVGRFEREAAILRRLEGPHVVRVFEAVEAHGMLALAMEHVAGTPLDRVIAERKPMDIKESVEIALQICAGLGTAHAGGVVHRDLKPANVLYSTDESGRFFVKVADFGLAKVVQGPKGTTSVLTQHDMIFGTPEYMAPEQARGDEVDARADIYAVGCLLYEMLTGDPPFHYPSPVLTMTAHLTKAVVPLRTLRTDGAVSPALEAVVMRALSKEPADRYPTARALAEALLAASTEVHVVAGPAAAADALSDTDLNVHVSGVYAQDSDAPAATSDDPAGVATTAISPQDPEIEPPAPSDTLQITAGGVPGLRRGAPAWVWIAIAVIAAIVGIGVGVLVGAR